MEQLAGDGGFGGAPWRSWADGEREMTKPPSGTRRGAGAESQRLLGTCSSPARLLWARSGPSGGFSSGPQCSRTVSALGALGRGVSEGVGGGGTGVGQPVLLGPLGGARLPLGQGRAGVPALGGAAAAAEQLALDVPEALPVVKPQLLAGLDEAGAEEGNAGEAQVLVGHEDAHGHQVGLAVVVDEAADVAIEAGVDAVQLPILGGHALSPGQGRPPQLPWPAKWPHVDEAAPSIPTRTAWGGGG